jgi:hypothetical protein
VVSFLRLQPVRAVAYRLIDANLFRHRIEERLKREYIVLDPQGDDPQEEPTSEPVPVHVRRAASGR